MSSTPPRMHSNPPPEAGVPYASYAQLVRMILPLTGKVSFYDAGGKALWISDGLEEPELRVHVEILLSRCREEAPGETPVDCGASEQGQPTYVFPIRDGRGTLVGALAVVFRDAANASYRRVETVERLLAPLLEILSYGWRARLEADAPAPRRDGAALQPAAPSPPASGIAAAFDPLPSPALLRRTLALATHSLQCAFGAFVMTDEPFTLTHRASPDESDVAMNAAIESVRAPMLKLMKVRSEALIVNAASGHERSMPYKFLVLPLRPANRLTALLMLFRSKREPDFTSDDVGTLTQVIARLAPPVLTESAREPVRAGLATSAAPPAMSSPGAPAQRAAPQTHTRPVPLVITADASLPLDARIRAALRTDSFDLFAQCITPLRDTRRPARYEVLVRMQDANQLRAPASFFEAAEAATLLPELDRWVIRRLLGTLKTHAERVRTGRWEFCINIAAQSLVAAGFREFLVAEVCRSAVPAGLLVFEVAESDALEHQQALALLGAHLRDVGCRLALDNCRAGLTTFGPLHKWPVSCVKIDGSLIGKLRSHARSESVVRAVTQLASSMGIETVAERVESRDVYDKLLDIGIDYAQGFHLGQPRRLTALFQ